ncbi:MAG: ribosome-associated translation inhibitor RaiA [Flavobacteriaceae bacterium]|nr:ribosome-associated translation inhibitor RaiA [Flavobacteriaceae bacterium]
MKVFTQSVNFNMDKDLKSYVEDKVTSLSKFYDKIIGAEVFLKVQKTSEKENKIAEIKLNVPGDDMMVKKLSKTFEESISLAVEALKRNLEKLKAKQRNH